MKLTEAQIVSLIRKADELYNLPSVQNNHIEWIDVCELAYKVRHDEAVTGRFDINKVLNISSQLEQDDIEVFIGKQLNKLDYEV